MKRFLPFALLLLLAAPSYAQSNALSLFATSQHNDGGSRFPSDSLDLTVDFDTGSGFGASYARSFAGRISGELALFRLSSDARIRERGGASMRLGDIDMTPITAIARIHLRPRQPFDMYAGAGAAYVMVGDLINAEAGRVPIDDELTLALGAGLTYDFGTRFGVVFDARYLPLDLRGHVDGEEIEAEMNPLLLSLGLRIRW